MARINLLPWREELRQRRKKDYLVTLFVAALVTVLVMGAWHLFNGQLIDKQKNRNQLLRNEIVKVDKKLQEIKNIDQTREKLQARIDVIQRLQRSRPESVRLMDEMVFMMPEGVVLDKIGQAGNRIEVEGAAQSNARVSALMRNVDESQWIDSPQLHVVENKQAAEQGMSRFKLTFFQKAAGAADAEGAQ